MNLLEFIRSPTLYHCSIQQYPIMYFYSEKQFSHGDMLKTAESLFSCIWCVVGNTDRPEVAGDAGVEHTSQPKIKYHKISYETWLRRDQQLKYTTTAVKRLSPFNVWSLSGWDEDQTTGARITKKRRKPRIVQAWDDRSNCLKQHTRGPRHRLRRRRLRAAILLHRIGGLCTYFQSKRFPKANGG